MSEWCAIYFYQETLRFTDCKSLTVGSREIKDMIDILEITYPKGSDGYMAKAFCEDKEVPIITDEVPIAGAYYCDDYMSLHREEGAGRHYWLKTVGQ